MTALYHFHIQELFPSIDGQPPMWVVDGCAPAEEIESFKRGRTSFLATSDIWVVPGPQSACIFKTHANCHPDGYTCTHIRDYTPPKGSSIFSKGASRQAWADREERRRVNCGCAVCRRIKPGWCSSW